MRCSTRSGEPLEQYPPRARERLLALRARVRNDGVTGWPRRPLPEGEMATMATESASSWWGNVMVGFVCLLVVGPWFVGAGFLLYLAGAAAVDVCTR